MEVPAVVTEYDSRWPEVFERLRDRLDAALVGVAHVIEHVGSTAVPGLAAKPIIDLDIVVNDEAAVGPAIKALGAAGWQHEGDLGIKGREAFRPPEDAAYHHLYLVVAESPPHRDHIDLRDFLRTHPGHAARYAALKRQLAALLKTDREAYVAGKHEMITEFLRLARSKGTTPPIPGIWHDLTRDNDLPCAARRQGTPARRPRADRTRPEPGGGHSPVAARDGFARALQQPAPPGAGNRGTHRLRH
jgi:GrpB-like predicted nucleotidyltransferase (UPF0157 family)